MTTETFESGLCSQTFSPEDSERKWITADQNFLLMLHECGSLLKCSLVKHSFPKDVEQNLTQQEEKHETLL